MSDEREIIIVSPVNVRKRQVVDLYDYVQKMARDIWTKHGEVPPGALLVGSVPEIGEVDVMMSSEFTGDSMKEIDFTKEIFSQTIQAAAVQFKATALAFVSEIWAIASDSPAQPPPGVSFEHVPGRLEAVMIVYEALGQEPLVSHAFISDDGKGTRTLGEFEKPHSHSQGRFVHMLPQPGKGQA